MQVDEERHEAIMAEEGGKSNAVQENRTKRKADLEVFLFFMKYRKKYCKKGKELFLVATISMLKQNNSAA